MPDHPPAARRGLVRLLLGTAFVVVASCSTPITGCGCSPPPPQLVVTGVVTTSSGVPRRDLFVRAELRAPACSATNGDSVRIAAGPTTTATDASGRYRLSLAITDGRPACLRTEVLADTLPSTVPLVVYERPGLLAGAWRDSVVIPLVVPPPAP